MLPEKKNMPDVKSHERKVSEIDSSEPTTLINKLQVADEGDHSLASKGFIRSERAGNFEQPIPSITDRFSEQKRTPSAAPTSNIITKSDKTPDKIPDKIIDSKDFHENNKNRDFLPPQPEKHNSLSTKKSSVVIAGQKKATENIAFSGKQLSVSTNSEEKEKPISKQPAVSENIVITGKKSMPDVKPYERKFSEIDTSELTTLINKLQVADEEDHSLASKGFIHSERAGAFEQPIPSITDRFSEQRKAPSAPPTIKVTIGRIDVRAVMHKVESTPVRRVAPQKPKLSLDDYLKQRSEGER